MSTIRAFADENARLVSSLADILISVFVVVISDYEKFNPSLEFRIWHIHDFAD